MNPVDGSNKVAPNEIRCPDFDGFAVDADQDLGTLFGLQHGLKLSPRGRMAAAEVLAATTGAADAAAPCAHNSGEQLTAAERPGRGNKRQRPAATIEPPAAQNQHTDAGVFPLCQHQYQSSIFIVPHATAQRNEIGSVSLALDHLREPAFFCFEVRDLLRDLSPRSNSSRSASLFLAYLHGLTARILPDPFTRVTGVAAAFRILRSGRARGNITSTLDDTDLGELKTVFKICLGILRVLFCSLPFPFEF